MVVAPAAVQRGATMRPALPNEILFSVIEQVPCPGLFEGRSMSAYARDALQTLANCRLASRGLEALVWQAHPDYAGRVASNMVLPFVYGETNKLDRLQVARLRTVRAFVFRHETPAPFSDSNARRLGNVLGRTKQLISLRLERIDMQLAKRAKRIVGANVRLFTELLTLQLVDCRLTATSVQALHIEALTQLRNLNLQRNGLGAAGAAALPLGAPCALRVLDLAQNRLDQASAALLPLHLAPNREELRLASNRLGRGVAQLPLHRAPNLQLLDLRDNALDGLNVAALPLQGAPALQELYLAVNDIGDVGAGALPLAKVPELRLLDLEETRLSETGVASLPLASCPKLRLLDLGSNAVTLATLVPRFAPETKLQTLLLRDAQVQSADARAHLGAPIFAALETLDLTDNAVHADDLVEVCAVGLLALRGLHLDRSNLCADSVARLKALRPNLKTHGSNWPSRG